MSYMLINIQIRLNHEKQQKYVQKYTNLEKKRIIKKIQKKSLEKKRF